MSTANVAQWSHALAHVRVVIGSIPNEKWAVKEEILFQRGTPKSVDFVLCIKRISF